MAVIEIILGERAPTGVKTPIEYAVVNEGFRANINGEAVFEPVALLRDRVAKLKARDNLLGAVLSRLGADPGARETEAHNAVGRLLADRENVSKIADRYIAAAEKIAHCLSLTAAKPDELADQVLGQHAELTEALAKAQERIKELEADTERLHHACGVAKTHAKTLEGSRDSFIARADLAEAEVKALTEENAKLKAELDSSAKALESANAKRVKDFNAALAAQDEIGKLKVKLAEADLDRMLAEARVSGLAAELQALEHALRSRLPLP